MKRWTHPSGAIIQFGHCEHEKDVTKYDTSEYNIVLWDEATSFTPYQYEYITFSRIRTSSPFLPMISRAGTNPGNIGHTYFRRRFVEPARDGNVIIKEHRKVQGVMQSLSRIYIPSKATDNTYLMQADPTYINRLNQLSATDRAAKLEGDWWIFSGQVFDDFRASPLLGEPKEACHVEEKFEIPYYWPKILSVDWGFSALTVALWAAINPVPSDKYPGKIYIYREYAAKRKKISEWGSDIARLSQGEDYTDICLDPSAWNNRGDDAGSISDQFVEATGLNPRKADHDRLGGKLLIQEYLRWSNRPKKTVPKEGFDQELYMRLHRIKGPKVADDYANLFQPESEEKYLPKLKIFNTCPGLIENLPKCIYVTESGRKNENNPEGLSEDVAELKNDVDDYYDTMRYLIKACQFYLDTGIHEHNKITQMAKIESQLEQTGNMTQYFIHRNEIMTDSSNRGIRRFRGFRQGRKLKLANF
jgi:hypothetical protein